jgi:hypothetical protein
MAIKNELSILTKAEQAEQAEQADLYTPPKFSLEQQRLPFTLHQRRSS